MDEKTARLKAEELFEAEEFLKIMRNVYSFNAEWDDSDNYLSVAGLYIILLPNVETLSELKLKLELSGIDWERPIRWENAEERQKYPTVFSEGE